MISGRFRSRFRYSVDTLGRPLGPSVCPCGTASHWEPTGCATGCATARRCLPQKHKKQRCSVIFGDLGWSVPKVPHPSTSQHPTDKTSNGTAAAKSGLWSQSCWCDSHRVATNLPGISCEKIAPLHNCGSTYASHTWHDCWVSPCISYGYGMGF